MTHKSSILGFAIRKLSDGSLFGGTLSQDIASADEAALVSALGSVVTIS